MSRLQTKCAFASAGVHALLLALLVVSSAFVKPPPPPDPIHFVTIFNASKITDDETQGGGNPNVPSDTTPPAPPPSAVIQQPVTPTHIEEPPTKLPEPIKKPEPAHVKRKKPPEPLPDPDQKETKKPEPIKAPTPTITKNPNATRVVQKNKLTEKPPEAVKPEKPKIQVDLTPQTYKPDPEAQRRKMERERAAKEEKEREEAERKAAVRAQMAAIEQANREHKLLQDAVSGVVGRVDTGLARTTNVEMPGPGGEAFINYADVIYTRYYQAWQTPDGRDGRTPVKAEIVVARDGRVISSNVIKSSGDAQLDKSVRQALERVTKLPAFPEGSRDAQRTFRISFELKSKRQFG